MNRSELIKMRISALEAELARLGKFGEDIFDNGEVLSFEKRFIPSGRAYTYTVLKVADRWHTSGPKGGGVARTWDDLVDFWSEGVDAVFRVTAWEQVF
jgi:hypothetical protein